MNRRYREFTRFKQRDGFERIFPYDIEEHLAKELELLKLTDENIEKARTLDAELAQKLEQKIVAVKEKARLAGILSESIESLVYSEAKVDELDKVLSRLQVLEAHTKELLIPWTRSQIMKSMPWLLVGLLIVALCFVGFASRSNPTSSPQPTPTTK